MPKKGILEQVAKSCQATYWLGTGTGCGNLSFEQRLEECIAQARINKFVGLKDV